MACVTQTVVPEAPAADQSPTLGGWIHRHRIGLLALLVLFGALIRVHGLTSGSLFTDDAWVAITNHESFSTALRMLVTTPGFTLFERSWSGLAPHTTWFIQLPSLVASLAGIVAVYALCRYFQFEAWISLVAASIIAISAEATAFATHIKPYPFDLLTAACLLWLGERARRNPDWSSLIALAALSVASCAWSFTNAVIVMAVYLVLAAVCLRRRSFTAPFLATAGVAAGLIASLYLFVIKPQVTPALSAYWKTSYIDTRSIHVWLHSTRASISSLFTVELGRPSNHHLLHAAGTLYGDLLLGLAVLGAIVAWRKNAMPLAALGLAYVLAAAHKIPLGSNRTDAYLFPAVLLLIASSLQWLAAVLHRSAPRWITTIATAAVCLGVVLGGISGLTNPPRYIGGDLSAAMPEVRHALSQPGTMVLIEPGTRFVWAYEHDAGAKIIFGPTFNTGYSFVSSDPRIVIVPNTPEEPSFSLAPSIAKLAAADHLVTVGYQIPSFPLDQVITARALEAACWVQTSSRLVDQFQVATYECTRHGCVPA